jgi:4-amino-4-deoxy-L-arabinose transferase-like glycosyltransferase
VTHPVPTPTERTRPDRQLLAALAALPLALYVASTFTANYGYFIDEFYYIACARRLAFGYVDHPPIAPLILAATMPVLGVSLLGLRLAAFLAASATVWVTGLLVWRLGGRRFATVLAGLSVGFAPVMLALGGFFSMNAFEPLLWSLIVLTLVRIVQTDDSRLWLLVGLLVGVAFENKHTVLMYVAALSAGMALTRTRQVLVDRWLWMGAAVALLVALPNVIWQIANGWPSLEFYHNAQVLKNQPSPPMQSLMMQVLVMNPIALPVWLIGLASLLFARATRPFRFLGVMFVVLLVIHVLSQTSRPDRTAAGYPILFAAGAVVIERWLSGLEVRTPSIARMARIAIPGLILAASLALSPITLPLLSPPATARLVAALGLDLASAERGKTSSIPQLLADRTGWESFVNEVERVYLNLPEADRAHALVYAPSYGHAGALELLGAPRGLPAVISGQNTYWHWSVGRTDSNVLIAVDANPEVLRQLFAEVWEAGRVRCGYCMSWRSDMPIFVARGPRVPLSRVWARYRHYE